MMTEAATSEDTDPTRLPPMWWRDRPGPPTGGAAAGASRRHPPGGGALPLAVLERGGQAIPLPTGQAETHRLLAPAAHRRRGLGGDLPGAARAEPVVSGRPEGEFQEGTSIVAGDRGRQESPSRLRRRRVQVVGGRELPAAGRAKEPVVAEVVVVVRDIKP